MLMTLFNKILTKNLESSKTYSKELEKAVNVPRNTISDYKTKPNSEIENFQLLLNIVRYLDKDREYEIMADYARHSNPNRKTARYMLEYFSCNRMLTEMDSLLIRMEKEAKNKQSIEYAKVYRLQYRRQTQDISPEELITELNNIKVTDHTLTVFIDIIKCYCYYDKDFHMEALDLTYKIQKEVELVKEKYLKNTLTAKLHEISSYISLWIHNDFEQATIHANKVLDSELGYLYRGYAYFILGYAQFFSNYESSKENLEKSLSIYEMVDSKAGMQNVRDAIEYLDVFYDKRNESTDYKNISMKYYNMALHNQELPGEFDSLKDQMGEENYYLIKGVSENNCDYLMLSMIKNVKTGNAFFANFPRLELEKRGYNKMILDELHIIRR